MSWPHPACATMAHDSIYARGDETCLVISNHLDQIERRKSSLDKREETQRDDLTINPRARTGGLVFGFHFETYYASHHYPSPQRLVAQ